MTTLTIPDNLAKSLPEYDEATLLDIFKKGLAQYQAEKGLEAYLPYLQTDNLIAASHQAKEKSHATIEDQGFSAIALFLTDFLANTIKQNNPSQTSTQVNPAL
jgi:hypothetical protein